MLLLGRVRKMVVVLVCLQITTRKKFASVSAQILIKVECVLKSAEILALNPRLNSALLLKKKKKKNLKMVAVLKWKTGEVAHAAWHMKIWTSFHKLFVSSHFLY